MVFKKQSIGTLFMYGFALAGCEMATPQTTFDEMKPPMAALKAKKEISPAIAHAFQLLKEEKYSEASTFLNQALQAHPKSVIFHILNGLTYEKLAEKGDAAGTELAAIGYQNAINLDPSNVFAITQLGKLKYNEQSYDQAQEHFANALLLKPNDADLLHEFAAASYYAYDVKSAIFAIDKAEKLKPEDPLINRSATMIHAAIGDFDTAKKHFAVFKAKLGNDPAVEQVAARFNDWESLYKSGRVTRPADSFGVGSDLGQAEGSDGVNDPNLMLAAVTPKSRMTSKEPPMGKEEAKSPPANIDTVDQGGQNDQLGKDNSDEQQKLDNPADSAPQVQVSEATNVLAEPLAHPEAASGPPSQISDNYGPQIIIDCYLLRITEDARTSKGNNIMENLAVTLSPGGFMRYKANMWGSGAPPLQGTGQFDNFTHSPATGFRANQLPAQTSGGGTPSAVAAQAPASTTFDINNKGSISGRVFAAGLTWAGLTYSLNIANAIDSRTEVVSRPSLMTFLKKQSVFFSGDELILGLSGQYGGTLVKYPIGVTLEVTPESLVGEYLTLTIGIEGSLLESPNPNLQQTVDVGKTRVDTFVKVRLGETLMLGGLYERLDVTSKNGFPGLQDIPVVQYFFSNETTLSRRRSIVFMLTPRSPDAVKSAVNRAMTREAVTPHLSELVNRNPDWFNTNPNLVKIFRYFSRDPIIYYEFRSGDVLPPSWGWELPLGEKLRQLGSFMYY